MARLVLLLLFSSACAVGGIGPARSGASERLLGSRLEEVMYGGSPRATAYGIVVERTRSGSALVWREQGDDHPTPDDTSLELAVRGRLATDPDTAPSSLDVDAQGGVVRLTGPVSGCEQAARVLRLAVETHGVHAVETRLFWTPERESARLLGSAAQ